MSNPESFIDEVNEELKRDRLFAAMRKYGWIAVVGVVVLVGGATYNEYRKAQATAEAQAFGDSVVAALESEDPAARAEALSAIQATGDRAGILNLLLGAAEVAAEDRPDAIAALALVENDSTLPASYRQLAGLKRVIIGGELIPADERAATLQALATPGNPFRALAMEQQVLLTMETGDREAALTQAQALLQEPDLTAGLRRRVAQIIVVLGGEQPTDLG
ncbi:tetratricopeptide repeat protein [Pararhodobacter sp. CCB-MM2]|uniref:tetratricopeptide repeat protein n=1 Tax=Pararhodobacter sp. CCB-MM2 TaxID=1786003 RepID=UPI00082D5DF6|nr:tetratricopeptide repeat protein [Pararhodobacter sp. CCB-MM2]